MTGLMHITLGVVPLKDNYQFPSSPSVWEHCDPALQQRSESALLDYLPTLTPLSEEEETISMWELISRWTTSTWLDASVMY